LNYYNNNDPFCCQWIENLIDAGVLPDGKVSSRDIRDIPPSDLEGYDQCHFFAGIGGWVHALWLAGWPRSKPIWTGSCPCQPFSIAGKGAGLEDPRHLWPAFRWLIAKCKPEAIVGEQVDGPAGINWCAGIYDDLEALGYNTPKDEHGQHELYSLPACSVGAPHIRSRLFWVAQLEPNRRQRAKRAWVPCVTEGQSKQAGGSIGYGDGGVADTEPQHNRTGQPGSRWRDKPSDGSATGRMADNERPGRQQGTAAGNNYNRNDTGRQEAAGGFTACDAVNFWSNSIFIPCADGKWRRVPGRVGHPDRSRSQQGSEAAEGLGHRHPFIPTSFANGMGIQEIPSMEPELEIEPALFPLADGLPGRVGILRGAGNAIVPQVAAEFIRAFLDGGKT